MVGDPRRMASIRFRVSWARVSMREVWLPMDSLVCGPVEGELARGLSHCSFGPLFVFELGRRVSLG